MVCKFVLENEKIRTDEEPILFSGNINTYVFDFVFNDAWDGLSKFAVFVKDKKAYTVCVTDNSVTVPCEILEGVGNCFFGIFATGGDDDIRRMSSECVCLKVEKGAYREDGLPSVPKQDLWEEFLQSTTPKKGRDYWTEEDIAEIKSYVEDAILGGEW